ncbi:beta-N-acetylhexosaminidase [Paenibacillus cellulositrophicus]|uniref:beta-N-acetylhexosaminidase n=1 Tax=Paenibacillus cellulositrophicus TaxID=562959 RepID=UPI002041A98F|nr:beta-N-acetylhexosaminidase [Paenibacillus cellulositrophicus]MCM2997708.1 beta-N-acetylhexosaminidase [Paenibacillus cellulositrophicus]
MNKQEEHTEKKKGVKALYRLLRISLACVMSIMLASGCSLNHGGNNASGQTGANGQHDATGQEGTAGGNGEPNSSANQGGDSSNPPESTSNGDGGSGKDTGPDGSNPGDTNTTADDPVLKQLNQLTTEEKIGQLVLVGMDGTATSAETRELVQKYYVGGFIFYKNNIDSTKQALSLFNGLKKDNQDNPVPLWMSVDEEGGRVSRMPDEFVDMPTNLAIGRKNSTELSHGIGQILGRELAGFGLNMDFAPVLDVNSNPDNPVIGDRSFGDDAERVARLGRATMEGIREEHVVPVVKHFPGHGDTSVDSHIGLPVVNHDLARLRKLELVPFQAAVKDQADVVMIAHLLMPKLDPDHPASFSKAVITDLLRKELGFKGVVISDDMTMGAIDKNYSIGKASVGAILAGGNIILIGHDYAKEKEAIRALKDAVKNGTISEEVLNDRVYAVLKLKRAYGLTDKPANGPDVDRINKDARSLLGKYGLK